MNEQTNRWFCKGNDEFANPILKFAGFPQLPLATSVSSNPLIFTSAIYLSTYLTFYLSRYVHIHVSIYHYKHLSIYLHTQSSQFDLVLYQTHNSIFHSTSKTEKLSERQTFSTNCGYIYFFPLKTNKPGHHGYVRNDIDLQTTDRHPFDPRQSSIGLMAPGIDP